MMEINGANIFITGIEEPTQEMQKALEIGRGKVPEGNESDLLSSDGHATD